MRVIYYCECVRLHGSLLLEKVLEIGSRGTFWTAIDGGGDCV